jgi:hypothetical protein
MLHNMILELLMAVGGSGRIVIEIDPVLKQELYGALAEQGMTLKYFFLANVNSFLDQKVQPDLQLFARATVEAEGVEK